MWFELYHRRQALEQEEITEELIVSYFYLIYSINKK